ncbi:MAG: RraA family protein [Synergistaceae bacterium]|jgi:RraA family protein|nr:RraA family protein [Synergistaceae bacterium]
MANVGFRQYLNIERPDRSVIDLFSGLPTPNICDNTNRLYAINGLRPFNKTRLLGPAFTVKVPAGDNLLFNRSIDLAQPGDILVVDGGGATERALFGEIMVSHAKKMGLGGIVVNGCTRDSEALAELDFPVFAIGTSPNGPYKNGPGEVNVPVVVGGMAVLPGDILIGDADGLVVIRPADAKVVAEKARAQSNAERDLLKTIEAGAWDRSNFADILASKGCEIIS